MTTGLGPLTPAEVSAGDLLGALVKCGWVFKTTRRNDDGEPTEIFGFRMWSGGWLDAILLRGLDDAMGWRSVPGNKPGVSWELSGGTAEVVRGLLELPPPWEPNAPKLVKAPAPRIWTPGTG